MKPAGPPPRQGHNPRVSEFETRQARVFLLKFQGKKYLYERVAPLIVSTKRRNKNFKLLLEEDRLSPQRVLLCMEDLLGIYRQMRPIGGEQLQVTFVDVEG